EMINQMAKGDLDVDVPEDLGLFNPLKEQLTRVRQGFKKAVEQEVKSERTKTELITNVSHDLKTPLTAIITYVNLLKQPGITEEERTSYIQVLDQKSMRLKVLIEDLFEVSKATSGAVTMNRGPVDIVSLIKQVRLELSDRMEASGVEFRWALPEEKIILYLDSQRTYRIFENLLVNITKYAMAGTRAYISLDEDESGTVTIILRNISAKELNVSPEELTERFVRGDASRNTEGSGLGLAIARSFTELQDGTMEVSVEGDLFRVLIRFKRMEEKPDGAERGNDGNDGNNGNDGGDWNGGGDGSDGSGSDEIERGARGFRGGLREIVRRKAGEATGKMGREFSKASKRRAAHERTKAREEELKRETARAKEAAKQREQAQTKDPEPEAEWDFGQDEAWNAVLDDGKEQERETP
ncbi:sensor histidine kinase, partial [Enterocloster lavalensis]